MLNDNGSWRGQGDRAPTGAPNRSQGRAPFQEASGFQGPRLTVRTRPEGCTAHSAQRQDSPPHQGGAVVGGGLEALLRRPTGVPARLIITMPPSFVGASLQEPSSNCTWCSLQSRRRLAGTCLPPS